MAKNENIEKKDSKSRPVDNIVIRNTNFIVLVVANILLIMGYFSGNDAIMFSGMILGFTGVLLTISRYKKKTYNARTEPRLNKLQDTRS